jgi:hypothetical protein
MKRIRKKREAFSDVLFLQTEREREMCDIRLLA